MYIKNVQNQKIFKDLIVATCDKEIFNEIINNKGKAIMTSHLHKGCISRIAEAVNKIDNIKLEDYICIVQGDEVLVNSKLLNKLCNFVKKIKKNAISLMLFLKLKITKNINLKV